MHFVCYLFCFFSTVSVQCVFIFIFTLARLSAPPCSPPLPPNELLSALHTMQQPSMPKENLQVPLKRVSNNKTPVKRGTAAFPFCISHEEVYTPFTPSSGDLFDLQQHTT